MKVALNKEVAPEVLSNLFNYYEDSNLTSNSSYEFYVEVAKEFLENIAEGKKGEIFSSLSSIIFVDDELFEFPDQISEEEKFDVVLGFENLITAVKNVIEKYEPKFLKFNGLKRQASPPIEAFKYVGHNELDIRESNDSYSLLFR